MAYIVYCNEMDLAATYALRRPKLARVCAAAAVSAAIRMRRPDLAAKANDFLSAI